MTPEQEQAIRERVARGISHDDAELLLAALDEARAELAEAQGDVEKQRQAVGDWYAEVVAARAMADHLVICKCPERPRCRLHGDDGTHQWLDMCEQPHEHGEPIEGRISLEAHRSRPEHEHEWYTLTHDLSTRCRVCGAHKETSRA